MARTKRGARKYVKRRASKRVRTGPAPSRRRRTVRRRRAATESGMGISRGVLTCPKFNSNKITVSRTLLNYATYSGASVPTTPTIINPNITDCLPTGTGSALLVLPDFNMYSLLFNQYRIKSIRVQFRHTTIEQTDAAVVPNLWIAPFWDYNYSTLTYSNLATMLNLKGCRRYVLENTGGTDIIDMKPKQFKYGVNFNSIVNSATPMKFPWTDVAYNSLNAWGLIWMVTGLPADQNFAIDIIPTVEFRQRR